MASVSDVAAYILNSQGSMTTMKLQKLCYYSQAWNLAWDGRPLFNQPIQAWANGPVVHELFTQHRGKFQVDGEDIVGNREALTLDERETIDAVLQAYGHLNGQQLSDLTHAERPWIEARKGLADGAFSNAVIDLETMQDFYGGLDATQS